MALLQRKPGRHIVAQEMPWGITPLRDLEKTKKRQTTLWNVYYHINSKQSIESTETKSDTYRKREKEKRKRERVCVCLSYWQTKIQAINPSIDGMADRYCVEGERDGYGTTTIGDNGI